MLRIKLSGKVCDDVVASNESDSQSLEKRLNRSKNSIEKYYGTKEWSSYEKSVEPYAKLVTFCKDLEIPFVTHAWLKYWELFREFNLIKPSTKAFFNAEFPGSGIAAFQHYVSTFLEKGAPADWIASSYQGEGSLPDSYGFHRDFSAKWLMTDTNNGDMTSLDKIDDVITRVGNVDFYSSDAGLDVSADWNAQENANWKLHLGCAYVGLSTLVQGGNCILKQYTFFSKKSWYLIQLYASCFDAFYITKPQTSKAKNSEIYLVGIGFRGRTKEVEKKLREIRTIFKEEKVSDKVCSGMPNEIFFALRDIYENQIRFLTNHVKAFSDKALRKPDTYYEELKVAWLNRYPVIRPSRNEDASFEGYKQGTYVVPFESALAFVTYSDKLSNLDISNNTIEVNEKLSRVLTYLYLACCVGTEATIAIPKEYEGPLKSLLPSHNFVTKESVEDIEDDNVFTIDEIDLSKVKEETVTYHGHLLKPVYVSRFSTILYDLRSLRSNPKRIQLSYAVASLNYFANVVRNSLSGKGYCIWRDPIVNETKLRDSYDVMFGLYVVDKYLLVTNSVYPDPNTEFRLAKALTVFDRITDIVTPKETSQFVNVKEFDEVACAYDSSKKFQSIREANVKVTVDEALRNFTELLFYLSTLTGLDAESTATVVISGFNNYSHIEKIRKFFPKIEFVIYGFDGKSNENVTYHGIVLTGSVASSYAKSKVYFVTTSKTNELITSKMNPVSACIRYSSRNTFLVVGIFASCFALNTKEERSIAIIQNAVAAKKPEYLNHVNFLDNFDLKWRNIDAFRYTNPIRQNREDSYDVVFLATQILQYCKVNNRQNEAEKLLSLALRKK